MGIALDFVTGRALKIQSNRRLLPLEHRAATGLRFNLDPTRICWQCCNSCKNELDDNGDGASRQIIVKRSASLLQLGQHIGNIHVHVTA